MKAGRKKDGRSLLRLLLLGLVGPVSVYCVGVR